MKRPVPGLPIEQQPAEILCRMCLWGEARGESNVGKLAVLWVIRNRASKSGKSIGAVILAPWQFSSFNDTDPNRGKLLTAYKDDPAGWAAIDALCEVAERGLTIDPTYGALNYYVTTMENPPKWGRSDEHWKETAIIDRHCFGIAGGR